MFLKYEEGSHANIEYRGRASIQLIVWLQIPNTRCMHENNDTTTTGASCEYQHYKGLSDPK